MSSGAKSDDIRRNNRQFQEVQDAHQCCQPERGVAWLHCNRASRIAFQGVQITLDTGFLLQSGMHGCFRIIAPIKLYRGFPEIKTRLIPIVSDR